MAVPTYDELVVWCRVNRSLMILPFGDDHKLDLAIKLESCNCELLATSLGIPTSEIDNITNNRMKTICLLECWKQRSGSMATYELLTKALLQINRTDLAEKVVAFTLSVRSRTGTATDRTQSQSSESNFASPPSPASSSGVEMSPSPEPTTPPPPSAHPTQAFAITQTLSELEEDFFQLVKFVEQTSDTNHIEMKILTRRFSMLPASIPKEPRDRIYFKTKRQILESKTTKEMIDNLT